MTEKQKSYETATINKLDKSRIEIVGSIHADTWEKHRAQAIKNINETIKLDGFRNGMVPENVLIAKVGEMAVLEEMAELALSPAYLDIIIDNKIDPIGKPNIQVTKLAKGNPLEFKILSAVVPEVTLPDYKKIAQEIVKKQNPDDVKVTEKDLEDTIMSVRRSATPHMKPPSDGSGGPSGPDHEKTAPHSQTKEADQTSLPELNDNFVKKLGAFSSVSDFKDKLKVMIAEQKREQAEEKLRIGMADALAENSKIDLPEVLVQSETSRIEAQFSDDIARMGVKLEDYLKHAKKTMDEVRQEWRPHAEKKARLQLILNAIAQKESIRPTDEEVEHEVKHILEHYPDANKDNASAYAETVLTNEKVFQFLENKNS